MRRSHSGITLLELTVVLGIVGIVIAMLLPCSRIGATHDVPKQSETVGTRYSGVSRHPPTSAIALQRDVHQTSHNAMG